MSEETVDCGFVSLTGAAYTLGVCEESVRRLAKNGQLKPYRVLGRLAFRRADVDALRAARSAGGN